MGSENNFSKLQPSPSTNRVKRFFFFNLLSILSLNIYAKTACNIHQKTIIPIPIPNISILKSISASASSASVTEHILVTMITPVERRQHVVWFAESHTDWGFRYSLGNASLDNGFDCSGFVKYVFNYFDIKSPRSSSEQYREGMQVPVELARGGDLVFFGDKSSVSHVAMVVSNDDKGLVVVHSTCTRGIIKENITKSRYWKPKLKDKAVNFIGL